MEAFSEHFVTGSRDWPECEVDEGEEPETTAKEWLEDHVIELTAAGQGKAKRHLPSTSCARIGAGPPACPARCQG